MDLDEMLALMAAPIYVGLMEWEEDPKPEHRNFLMRQAVTEARMIWDIARAQARAAGRGRDVAG